MLRPHGTSACACVALALALALALRLRCKRKYLEPKWRRKVMTHDVLLTRGAELLFARAASLHYKFGYSDPSSATASPSSPSSPPSAVSALPGSSRRLTCRYGCDRVGSLIAVSGWLACSIFLDYESTMWTATITTS